MPNIYENQELTSTLVSVNLDYLKITVDKSEYYGILTSENDSQLTLLTKDDEHTFEKINCIIEESNREEFLSHIILKVNKNNSKSSFYEEIYLKNRELTRSKCIDLFMSTGKGTEHEIGYAYSGTLYQNFHTKYTKK